MEALANFLVVVGALVLVAALIPVKRLWQRLPCGSLRFAWMLLSVFIGMFIVGYLLYAHLFWGAAHHWSHMVVPAIFNLGALFVLIVCSLSAKTADDVTRLCHLEHENVTDPLMGIYNRRYLDRSLSQEVAKARRYGLELSVMMIDIDYFKRVNDSFGHSVGDRVLQSLARLLDNSVRDFDRVFRYGGEEIVLLLPYTGIDGAMVLADRLRGWVEERVMVEHAGQEISITISCGISSFCPDSDDEGTLMARADEALYRAKRLGRNRVERALPPEDDKVTVLQEAEA